MLCIYAMDTKDTTLLIATLYTPFPVNKNKNTNEHL